LKAEPQSTGTNAQSDGGLADQRLQRRRSSSSLPSRYGSISVVVDARQTASSSLSRYSSACVLQVGRDLVVVELRRRASRPRQTIGLHLDQVDDALEVDLGADRQLDRTGVRAEAVDHRVDAAVEVGADAGPSC
jgi:hypothetical protein